MGMKLYRLLKTPHTTAVSHDTVCATDYSLIFSKYLIDAAKPIKTKMIRLNERLFVHGKVSGTLRQNNPDRVR